MNIPTPSPYATDGQRTTDAECWMNYCLEAEKELTAAREERTKVVEKYQAAVKEMHEVGMQRDRLAEALWSTLNQDHGSAIRAGILLRSLNIQSLNQTEP